MSAPVAPVSPPAPGSTLAATHTTASEECAARRDKSYKMGEEQEGSKTFRISIPGEFDLCKTEDEKEHVKLKRFAFCLKMLKPVMAPHGKEVPALNVSVTSMHPEALPQYSPEFPKSCA